MEQFTLKRLREIATKHKIPNRSKYKKKAELYESLKAHLGETLETLETSETNALISFKKSTPGHSVKPTLRCITTYDYVVIQSKSTKRLFPLVTEEHKVNENVTYIYGIPRFEAVWAISGVNSGPIGFRGCCNSPFKTKFVLKGGAIIDYKNLFLSNPDTLGEEEEEEEEVIYADESIIIGMWITPTVSPAVVGYQHLLDKYGRKTSTSCDGEYFIEKYVNFEEELCELIPKLNYQPEFVPDIVDTLESKGNAADECLIYQNVERKDLAELKEYLLEAKYDEITEFGCSSFFKTERLGYQIIYLQAS